MSNILRAYIQIFFTPPRKTEVDLEDMEVFYGSDDLEALSPQVFSRNSSVAILTKKHSLQMKAQISPILANTGTSEPILRGLLHRVSEESHGPSMIKMYLKLIQDLTSIQMNRVRQLAYGPVVPPPEEEARAQADNQLYPSFAGTFSNTIKNAEYSMLLMNGVQFSDILSEEIRTMGRSSRVRDLIEMTKQLHGISDEVRSALVGITVRKRLSRTRKPEPEPIKYTRHA